MLERRCCRCRQVIEPLEDFFSRDFENSKSVYCSECIEIVLENDWFDLSLEEKAELMGFGCYFEEDPDDADHDAPIPGQIDMFGGDHDA